LGARAAVSLPGTPLAGAVLTGNPVRRVIARSRRSPAAPPLVVITGGSLGARSINDAALALYDRWRARHDVQVRHVAGRRDHARCREQLAQLRRDADVLSYELVDYEDDMAGAYARATVFVCRAGAVTCAELTATGTPAVLVPLPGAPADHQTKNAEALAGAGAGVLVTDADLAAPDLLPRTLDELLGDDDRRAGMERAARALGRPDAAARVADLVDRAAGSLVTEAAA
jgi:UDP-N-acetylglucosamine:LPS N-acetylglucosamine transferase